MRTWIISSILLLTASLSWAKPRNPLPQTPDQIWQNDLDLLQDINTGLDEVAVSSTNLPTGSTNYIQNRASYQTDAQFNVSSGTAITAFFSNENNTIVQYSVTESTNSGMRIREDDQVELLSRNVVGPRINATGQTKSVYDGTACLPAFTWNTDAGTGLYLPTSDNLGFGVGCSTAMTMSQVSYADKQESTPFTIHGGSTSLPGQLSRTSFHIWTATATTTPNQVAQINQTGALVLCSGRTTDSTARFTDLLLSSFYLPAPTVVAAHTDLGAPAARTYSSGGSSTGILRLAMAAGNYVVECFSMQNFGK